MEPDTTLTKQSNEKKSEGNDEESRILLSQDPPIDTEDGELNVELNIGLPELLAADLPVETEKKEHEQLPFGQIVEKKTTNLGEDSYRENTSLPTSTNKIAATSLSKPASPLKSSTAKNLHLNHEEEKKNTRKSGATVEVFEIDDPSLLAEIFKQKNYVKLRQGLDNKTKIRMSKKEKKINAKQK